MEYHLHPLFPMILISLDYGISEISVLQNISTKTQYESKEPTHKENVALF